MPGIQFVLHPFIHNTPKCPFDNPDYFYYSLCLYEQLDGEIIFTANVTDEGLISHNIREPTNQKDEHPTGKSEVRIRT